LLLFLLHLGHCGIHPACIIEVCTSVTAAEGQAQSSRAQSSRVAMHARLVEARTKVFGDRRVTEPAIIPRRALRELELFQWPAAAAAAAAAHGGRSGSCGSSSEAAVVQTTIQTTIVR
jgi:hypothetical protein